MLADVLLLLLLHHPNSALVSYPPAPPSLHLLLSPALLARKRTRLYYVPQPQYRRSLVVFLWETCLNNSHWLVCLVVT